MQATACTVLLLTVCTISIPALDFALRRYSEEQKHRLIFPIPHGTIALRQSLHPAATRDVCTRQVPIQSGHGRRYERIPRLCTKHPTRHAMHPTAVTSSSSHGSITSIPPHRNIIRLLRPIPHHQPIPPHLKLTSQLILVHPPQSLVANPLLNNLQHEPQLLAHGVRSHSPRSYPAAFVKQSVHSIGKDFSATNVVGEKVAVAGEVGGGFGGDAGR
jgi:hypothetical protein